MVRRYLKTPVALATVLFLFAAATTRRQEEEVVPPPELAAAAARTTTSTTTITLTYKDFMEFEAVRDWVKDTGNLADLIPKKIEISVGDVSGDIPAAGDGYLAFNLINAAAENEAGYVSSLLVVMNLTTLIQVYPTFALPGGLIHFDGLKLRDPSSLLLAGNNDTMQKGPQYVWNWKTNEFKELADGAFHNCHDIQWAYDDAAYWMPGQEYTAAKSNVMKIAAKSGKHLASFDLGSTAQDINHIGLLKNDTIVIASNRMDDSIIKSTLNGIEWIAGGENGTLWLKNLKGQVFAPGETSLYYGQHNAEYFGESEYMMYDNQYEQRKASRMLIVRIEGTTVEEIWEWEFEEYPWGYTPEFGDVDRLPTGHLLGSFWPDKLSKNNNILYESRITEVNRDTKDIVYDLKVYGKLSCEDKICKRGTSGDEGWKLYSVERFYSKPLVYNVSCDPFFSFTTHNNFKQNNYYPGNYHVPQLGLTGNFQFLPHWRPTLVVVATDTPATTDLTLLVTNQFGDSTEVFVQCAAASSSF
ncbi:hypothetical protein CTAYLR_008592 [Chrysophaeum taylorii]|uniref:Uncharacterized protein n=1 Tax=Chrysophaeum taylorii TaxID=2483200 RepID=A0AAD7ULU2_9STRA|nr:hypothetical protein CTAYLR_008592 [Chrysophaeum taylorii]